MVTPSVPSSVCLVTGGTRGLGRAIAEALAVHGATVVVTGREPGRTAEAVAAMRQATGNSEVHGLSAELSDFAAVRALARTFLERFDRLDVLVHNAGAMFPTRQVTATGLELTLAINHLAPFLLTALLRERLWASAPARVLVVSSYAHRFGRPRLDDLHGVRRYDMDQAYYQSKAANVLFAYALARRWAGHGVSVNALEPGQMPTDMGLTYPGLKGWLNRVLILPLFGRDPADTARECVHLVTAPELAGVTGQYFWKGRPIRSASFTYSEPLADALWSMSVADTGVDPASADPFRAPDVERP